MLQPHDQRPYEESQMSREEEILGLQSELDSLRELASGDRPRLDDVIDHGSLGDKQIALELYRQRMALLDRLENAMNALMQRLQNDRDDDGKTITARSRMQADAAFSASESFETDSAGLKPRLSHKSSLNCVRRKCNGDFAKGASGCFRKHRTNALTEPWISVSLRATRMLSIGSQILPDSCKLTGYPHVEYRVTDPRCGRLAS